MLLKPGAQRGWYHDRKPEFREFQSLFAGSGTKGLDRNKCYDLAIRSAVLGLIV